jgi:hypothetical protein
MQRAIRSPAMVRRQVMDRHRHRRDAEHRRRHRRAEANE